MDHNKIFSVINWFLSQSLECLPIFHSTLGNLVYFVQCWSVVLNGKRMFENDCLIWEHRVIYPEIDELFAEFINKPLPMVHCDIALDADELNILEIVKHYYYDIYNARALEKVIYAEEPYMEAKKECTKQQKDKALVCKSSIESYYQRVAQDYNININDTSGIKEYLSQLL